MFTAEKKLKHGKTDTVMPLMCCCCLRSKHKDMLQPAPICCLIVHDHGATPVGLAQGVNSTFARLARFVVHDSFFGVASILRDTHSDWLRLSCCEKGFRFL